MSASFEGLSPLVVLDALSSRYGLNCQPLLQPFNSYVNRVYGVKDEENRPWIVKFYRPGRWNEAMLREEHVFLQDCHAAELPVVPPIPNADGDTLARAETDEGDGMFFAVFPQKAGRSFDLDRPDDFRRLGSLVGRLHAVAATRVCPSRLVLAPWAAADAFAQELWDSEVVHPDIQDEFFDLLDDTLEALIPAFEAAEGSFQRLHGDLHRGNILDRPGEGLLLMDFDDMLTGPPVQDLWMLLPDRVENCPELVDALEQGYRDFRHFDPAWWNLVEGLRFLRMLYFTAWCARQRHDEGFLRSFPDWGSKAFWIKELEDWRMQTRFL